MSREISPAVDVCPVDFAPRFAWVGRHRHVHLVLRVVHEVRRQPISRIHILDINNHVLRRCQSCAGHIAEVHRRRVRNIRAGILMHAQYGVHGGLVVFPVVDVSYLNLVIHGRPFIDCSRRIYGCLVGRDFQVALRVRRAVVGRAAALAVVLEQYDFIGGNRPWSTGLGAARRVGYQRRFFPWARPCFMVYKLVPHCRGNLKRGCKLDFRTVLRLQAQEVRQITVL